MTGNIIHGGCLGVLSGMDAETIDCAITSSPYWGQRVYEGNSGIGLEDRFDDYVSNLVRILDEVRRVLRKDGSLWLNLGDKYRGKDLMGMPWTVALTLKKRGWILRNDVIWDKIKTMQSGRDKLRSTYEHVFHFVKGRRYHYDRQAILLKSGSRPRRRNGKIVSITGTSGTRYRKQIDASMRLTDAEKRNARRALDGAIGRMGAGDIVDFRMTIRGQQRTVHGTAERMSGRTKELHSRGFYIMTQGSEGHLPTDIWRIVPEDMRRTDIHCAVYPEALLEIPIKSTCPPGGVVLDPFCGTGTTCLAAQRLGRSFIGIDVSEEYCKIARRRIDMAQTTLEVAT